MEYHYWSEGKLNIAKQVVDNERAYTVGGMKNKDSNAMILKRAGQAKKLEGDKLVDFIYEGLGGKKVALKEEVVVKGKSLKGEDLKEMRKVNKEKQAKKNQEL